MDEACIGSLLDTVTTGMGLMLRQELVYADRHLSLIHFYPEMLVEFTVGFIANRLQQFVVFQIYVFHRISHGAVTSSKSSSSPMTPKPLGTVPSRLLGSSGTSRYSGSM